MWLGLWSRSRSTGYCRALGPGGTRRRRCRSRPGPIVWARGRRDGRHRGSDGRYRRHRHRRHRRTDRPWPQRPGWPCWPPPCSAPRVSGNSTENGIGSGSRHRAPAPIRPRSAPLPPSCRDPLPRTPAIRIESSLSPRSRSLRSAGIPGAGATSPPPPSSRRFPGSASPIPRGSVSPPSPGIPRGSPGERGIHWDLERGISSQSPREPAARGTPLPPGSRDLPRLSPCT